MPTETRPPCPFYGFRLSPDLRVMTETHTGSCALETQACEQCLYEYDDEHGPDWPRCVKAKDEASQKLFDILRLETRVFLDKEPAGVPFGSFSSKLEAQRMSLSREGV